MQEKKVEKFLNLVKVFSRKENTIFPVNNRLEILQHANIILETMPLLFW